MEHAATHTEIDKEEKKKNLIENLKHLKPKKIRKSSHKSEHNFFK